MHTCEINKNRCSAPKTSSVLGMPGLRAPSQCSYAQIHSSLSRQEKAGGGCKTGTTRGTTGGTTRGSAERDGNAVTARETRETREIRETSAKKRAAKAAPAAPVVSAAVKPAMPAAEVQKPLKQRAVIKRAVQYDTTPVEGYGAQFDAPPQDLWSQLMAQRQEQSRMRAEAAASPYAQMFAAQRSRVM